MTSIFFESILDQSYIPDLQQIKTYAESIRDLLGTLSNSLMRLETTTKKVESFDSEIKEREAKINELEAKQPSRRCRRRLWRAAISWEKLSWAFAFVPGVVNA
jgi:DNA repair exonuclease SbcCD ATPase subunit